MGTDPADSTTRAPHWHARTDTDEGYYTADTVFGILDAVRFDMDSAADHHHQGADGAADHGEYDDAWRDLRVARILDNLIANIDNVTRHYELIERAPVDYRDATPFADALPDRVRVAPLFRGPDGLARLTETAQHTALRISNDAPYPYAVWQCPHEKCEDYRAWLTDWRGGADAKDADA